MRRSLALDNSLSDGWCEEGEAEGLPDDFRMQAVCRRKRFNRGKLAARQLSQPMVHPDDGLDELFVGFLIRFGLSFDPGWSGRWFRKP